MRLKKFDGNPILSPNPDQPWEDLAVCNPGAWYEDGTFYLLYRAAGDDEEHVIRMGLATSTDGVTFERASEDPVFGPSADGPDSGCVEDARIVRFGDMYYVTYAYRPFFPGRYWTMAADQVQQQEWCDESPLVLKGNIANSGLAVTSDFKTFRRLGRITQTDLDDRDVILFPERVGGNYVRLHRPKEWIGSEYGTEYPAIWISFSHDMLEWTTSTLLAGGEYDWERKIGGSTPPLRTDRGWLTLYHGVDDKGIYRVGAMLLDLNDPTKILSRLREPIMEPEHEYETKGLYNGCVFPTGNVIVDGTLYVYYGAADQYCGVATCGVQELLDAFDGDTADRA